MSKAVIACSFIALPTGRESAGAPDSRSRLRWCTRRSLSCWGRQGCLCTIEGLSPASCILSGARHVHAQARLGACVFWVMPQRSSSTHCLEHAAVTSRRILWPGPVSVLSTVVHLQSSVPVAFAGYWLQRAARDTLLPPAAAVQGPCQPAGADPPWCTLPLLPGARACHHACYNCCIIASSVVRL